MMPIRLFDQQKKLETEIINQIQAGETRIVIYGDSGCGKTFLSENIIYKVTGYSEDWSILRFVGDINCIEKDYYPIVSGLDSYCIKYNITKTVAGAIPKLIDESSGTGRFFSYILETILNRTTDNSIYINEILNDVEIDLLYKIKSCINRKNCLIYLDNLQWWDQKSINFFYLLLKHFKKHIKKLSSSIIICNVTKNQETYNQSILNSIIYEFHFYKCSFKKMSLDEYKACLLEIGLQDISDSISNLLYKLTKQNLAITKSALLFPESFYGVDTRIDEKTFLRILIEKKLKQMGATGEQITEVLKYASLIGLAFSLLELEYLVPYNDEKIREIINQANDLYLVEPQKSLYHFTHEVIRELFRKKLEDNNYIYCEKSIQCLKILHPYNYKTRIKYLLMVGNIIELEKIYCLEICNQLERNGFCEYNIDLNIIISEEIKDFIDNIEKAYKAFHIGDYTKAVYYAQSIENIYPVELLAIRDSIISQSLTKQLNNSERQKAVEIIKDYYHKYEEFSEKQVWTKTMLCLLAAYIHVRDLANAQKILDELYLFYGRKAKLCEDYKKELNVLRRKSTPFYEVDIAGIYLKKSVNYFSPKDIDGTFIRYPRQYFMSLTNFGANQACLGNFTEAFNLSKTAIDLYNHMPGIHFPRLEIVINNYLLSGYLSNKMALKDTIVSFNTLLSEIKQIADKTIIMTNLAALYLLDLQQDKANEILHELDREIEKSNCNEFSYEYHVKVNLLIIEIINRNWIQAKKLVKSLENIVPNLYQNYYFRKKHEILSQYVSAKKSINYDDSFSKTIIENASLTNSSWRFYGIFPALNTLEYWSEP
jgi:hypothetical protein